MSYRWIDFDPANWATQEHPPERKLVLVQGDGQPEKGLPPSVSVGYLRFAAGCKDSPYFVVPGVARGKDVAWCDCLPEGFGAPLWPGYPVQRPDGVGACPACKGVGPLCAICGTSGVTPSFKGGGDAA